MIDKQGNEKKKNNEQTNFHKHKNYVLQPFELTDVENQENFCLSKRISFIRTTYHHFTD